MKKLLSLAIVAAALGASVGCDDKKTTPPKSTTTSGPGANSGSGSGGTSR
jgi:hypothetical protein